MRIKSKRPQYIFILLLILQAAALVGIILVFVLPRIQGALQQKTRIIPVDDTGQKNKNREGGSALFPSNIFARPSGSVFYTLDCKHGFDFQKTSPHEFVWFLSKDEARGRGLELSKGCQQEDPQDL